MQPTPQQVKDAKRWLGSYYADEDPAQDRGSRLPHDEQRKTCRDVLAAYERVVVLMDAWEAKARYPGPNDMSMGYDHLCFWLELRQAMMGEE